MEVTRKPLQGVVNIIRFNRHFYVAAVALLLGSLLIKGLFTDFIQDAIIAASVILMVVILVSLSVSLYVYDLSGFYQLNWIDGPDRGRILNIHAGFDETSKIIQIKFPNARLTICDFYDPACHTEISIKRARLAYPPHPATIVVRTHHLPFADDTFNKTIIILSAHEIRCDKERARFLAELHRVTKTSGLVLITEHLRDLNNFLAYTIGFFHFYPRKCWLKAFSQAGFTVKQEVKTTPFITTFILEKNGNTA
jgi:hypothetical protein